MTIRNLKHRARELSETRGTSYQTELDAIAKSKGFDSWGFLQKSLVETQFDFEAVLLHGWRRRYNSLIITIEEDLKIDFQVKDQVFHHSRGTRDQGGLLYHSMLKETGLEDRAGWWGFLYKPNLDGTPCKIAIHTDYKDKRIEWILDYDLDYKLDYNMDPQVLERIEKKTKSPNKGLFIICGGIKDQQQAVCNQIMLRMNQISGAALFGDESLDEALEHARLSIAFWVSNETDMPSAKAKVLKSDTSAKLIGGLDIPLPKTKLVEMI